MHKNTQRKILDVENLWLPKIDFLKNIITDLSNAAADSEHFRLLDLVLIGRLLA